MSIISRSYRHIAGILLLMGVCFHFVNAQQLKSPGPNGSGDSSAIMLLINRGDSLRAQQPGLALQYYSQADSLCQATGNEKLIFEFYSYYSWLLNNANRFSESMDLCNRALAIARQMNDTPRIAYAYMSIGLVNVNMAHYQLALEHYLKASTLFEETRDTEALCRLYGRISGCYYPLKLYDQSLEYEKKTLSCLQQKHDTGGICASLFNAGLILKEQGKYDEAYSYYQQAAAVNSSMKDKIMDCRLQFALASLMNAREDYKGAVAHARKGLDISSALRFESGMAMNLAELGRAHLGMGQFREAKNYLTQSVNLSLKNNLNEELMLALDPIRFAEAALGNFKSSAEYDKMYRRLTDSIFNQQSSATIQELEAKYQASKKEIEIEQLKIQRKVQELAIERKNILNALLAGSAVILAIISILSYRNYRQKQMLQQQRIIELETEKKLAATEAILRGEEQERSRVAKDLHDGLGGMLSGIKYSLNTMKGNLVMTPDNAQAFERSMDMLDSSIRELRRVAHNMMPEALVKFGLDTALRDFCNEIRQTGSLQVTYQSIGLKEAEPGQPVSIIIYRIVQELINNVIKHAGAASAVVQVSRTNGFISITVEDDGKGFDPESLSQTKGIGWTNIRSRVEYLKGKLDIQSSPGKGTSVLIEFNTT